MQGYKYPGKYWHHCHSQLYPLHWRPHLVSQRNTDTWSKVYLCVSRYLDTTASNDISILDGRKLSTFDACILYISIYMILASILLLTSVVIGKYPILTTPWLYANLVAMLVSIVGMMVCIYINQLYGFRNLFKL